MIRRDFIKNTAISSMAAPLFNTCNSLLSSPKYKLGLQLFTVRADMAKAPLDTLKAVKAMGYEDFETYGYNHEDDTIYGWRSAEFKTILDDLGLTTTSGHFGFSPFLNEPIDNLERFVDQCIIGAHNMNMKYITWPWISTVQRTMDNFKIMAQLLNKIGEQVKKGGLGFAYHNHGFEFEDHNGQNGYDIILKDTDPTFVKLQMDMYWVMHSSSQTPKELIAQHPGRYVMWHIKDMDKVTRDYTELGNGSIDYHDIALIISKKNYNDIYNILLK